MRPKSTEVKTRSKPNRNWMSRAIVKEKSAQRLLRASLAEPNADTRARTPVRISGQANPRVQEQNEIMHGENVNTTLRDLGRVRTVVGA